MRSFSIALAITLLTFTLMTTAVAQQKGAPQAPVTYKSAADVSAMIAKAKAQNDAKAQATISQAILRLAPYNVLPNQRSHNVIRGVRRKQDRTAVFLFHDRCIPQRHHRLQCFFRIAQ